MKKFAIFGLFTLLFSSCSKDNNDDSSNGKVTLKASSTITASRSAKGTPPAVVLSDFNVNIGSIKFHLDDDSNDSIEDNIRLKGPFLLDLLDPNQSISQVVTTANIPNGKYEKVKFKFIKSIVPGDMFGKTFLIKGKVNDKDFIIWSQKELHLKIDFEDDSDVVLNNDDIILNIKIKLDAIIKKISELDALNSIKDGNGDGIIEISTTEVDGNKKLGDLIRVLLESNCHLHRKD
jgi:hypothetical protein